MDDVLMCELDAIEGGVGRGGNETQTTGEHFGMGVFGMYGTTSDEGTDAAASDEREREAMEAAACMQAVKQRSADKKQESKALELQRIADKKQESKALLFGDLDGDGDVDWADALSILDLNGDGQVNLR